MPRRMIVTIKKIYERRADSWAYHYRNREKTRIMCQAGREGLKIETILNQYLPTPVMEIDGYILDIPFDIRREHANQLLNRLNLSPINRELLCSWYWTESGWQELVHQYQSLPDVYEDYYYQYEPEPIDRLILVPMSAKPKQGSIKSGTSQVQVRYKSWQKGTPELVEQQKTGK